MPVEVDPPRYEAELAENIEQVGRKIRLVDLGRGALMLACLVFGYLLLAALFDLSTGGSDGWGPIAIRLTAFVAFLVAAIAWSVRIVQRFLQGVNPYYAARQIEVTVPDSKNSLINWLDLKDKSLPPVIHKAVGVRAARDAESADPDLITSPRDLWKLSATTGILLLGLLILLAVVPRQFGSLMSRAVLPLGPGGLPNRTVILVVKPGEGEVTVPAHKRVDFQVRIDGPCPPANSPGAPTLHYRHTANDVAVKVPLEEDNLGQWTARLSPEQLRTGLFWKVTVGDASTPEHSLRVRAQPFVTQFEATYTYRPYRKLVPETVTMPNELMPQPRLLGHRGTDVVLKARANTAIRSGSLELELQGKKSVIRGELPASEPNTLLFRLGLEQSGTFRILFDTPDGERNLDRTAHPIEVFDDVVPFVELVKPGKDLVAPANGTVLLAGIAIDDFGVTALALNLQLAGKSGPRSLASRPYQPKSPLKLANGTFPVTVEYVDILPLDQLRDGGGKQVSLVPGDELTYWLEATDNHDFGRPHVGKSKSFKITIQDGLQPANEQKQERAAAKQKRDQHDQEQSQQRDQQNQAEKDDNGQAKSSDGKKGDSKNGDGPGDKGDDHLPDSKDPSNSPKSGNGDNKGDSKGDDKPGEGMGGANKEGAGQDNKPSPEKQQLDQLKNDLAKTAEPINDALGGNKSPADDPMNSGKNEGKKDPSGDSKSSPDSPGGEGKDRPKDGAEANPKDSGEPKDGPNPKDKSGAEPKSKPKSDSKKSNDKDGGAGSETSPGDEKKGAESKNPNKSPGGGDSGAAGKSKPEGTPGGDPNKAGAGDNKTGDGPGKSTDKRGDPDLVDKGKTSNKAVTEPGAKKSSDGKSPDGKPRPAEAKNGEKSGDSSKVGKSDPQRKDPLSKPGNGEPPAGQKPGDASFAKEDGKDGKGEPTKEQIDALKELLKKGGPEADAAAKDLVKRAQDMKDPDLKKELEKALGDAGREDDLKELAGGERELLPQPEKSGDGTGEKDKGLAPDKGATKNQGNDPSAKTEAGSRGIFDDLKAITPEEAFKRRMGSLQLENLDDVKKRVTPEVLKKANVGDAEWQRFLQNARKYQELIKQMRQKEDSRVLRGGRGTMGPQGPRAVETGPGNRDPLTGATAVPPWEFRDAQREFTRKSKTP